MITALLLNWKRPDNLKKIIDSLKNQVVKINIFVWNNNTEDETDYGVDLQINSTKNLMCSPRWLMSCYSKDEYIFSLDDDLIFKDENVLKDCVENYSDGLIGYSGVVLNETKQYWQSIHYHSPQIFDKKVDIVKGRFIFCKKEKINNINWNLYEKAENFRIEDDIIISSFCKEKILPAFLRDRIVDLPAPYALFREPDHRKSRQEAVDKYFG